MTQTAPTPIAPTAAPMGRLRRIMESDLLYSFTRQKLVMLAAFITAVMILGSILSPWIAPHNPYDLRSLNLLDSNNPPSWIKGGDPKFWLGTDDQGRDIFSTILYGTRASIAISACAVLLALSLGVSLGLVAGYVGGKTDTLIMRIADVQLTFPAILTALMVDGVAKVVLKGSAVGENHFWILVVAIGLS